MKTYLRSVFLPFVGLQILFKLLNTFLVIIYTHFLYSNALSLQGAGTNAAGISQLMLILSPFILFTAYKYFYRHIIPIMILLMCGLISAVGLQWGDPILLNSLRGALEVLVEGVLFWQLVLLTTSEEKARWYFPLYVLLASAMIMLMHVRWVWADQINIESLTNLYGILAVLVVAIIALVYRFQSVNDVNLKIHETFIQSFGTVFTNPLFIGVLCILVGSNVVHQILRTPPMVETIWYVNVVETIWYVNGVGLSFIILAFFILPKEFFSKNIIIGGFALWLLGINLMGLLTLFEGLRQGSDKATFILMWPTVILYPLIYRGFLKADPAPRILGFTYVIIFSFLLSRLAAVVLRFV